MAARFPMFMGLAFALATPLSAQTSPAMEQSVMIGTIGPYRVGMNLTIRDATQIAGGHYYYASKLADILLSGKAEGENVTLREAGGGTFALHLVGNGSNGGKPLTFATSVGLAGTWTQDGKTLPVDLHFDQTRNGAGGERWYTDVTDASDAHFEAMVRRFLHSVLNGDRAEAAAAVSYPLTVNGGHPPTIRDKAALLSHWDAVFTPLLVAQLRDAIPHEMFVHNGQAMLVNGDVWFDGKGATAINLPK